MSLSSFPRRLLTADEYKAAMQRIDTLMSATSEPELSELSELADEVAAYEALGEATDALIAEFLAVSVCRNIPGLRERHYRPKAEAVVRAWIAALNPEHTATEPQP